MARAPFQRPQMAYVIEVIDEDGRFWHAMASEWGRIMHELKPAPPALAITIYEWQLALPINPRDFFTKYPEWKRIAMIPWSLEREHGDQD